MDPADEIDPSSSDGHVRWPLVERRHPIDEPEPPVDVGDRRQPAGADASGTPRGFAPITAPLWPFRFLALAGAVVQGRHQFSADNWHFTAGLTVATLYAVFATVRPIPHRDDARVRMRLVVEQALHTFLVLLTGSWASPLALCLIPTAMVAGFAAGTIFAGELALACFAVVSVQQFTDYGLDDGFQEALLWAGLLGLVTFTSGLSQRATIDAARQKELALVRVSRLAEANSLLFALQRVAQSMPASLDLDDVVDSTIKRVQSLVPSESISLHLANDTDHRLELFRSVGSLVQADVRLDDPPTIIRSAIDAPRTVRLGHITPGSGLSVGAQSGIYAALRARGRLIGLLSVESDSPDAYTQQHSEILHGLAEAFGIAIDNARLFRQIRSASANEERGRIARDLHDQVGSSLAFLGFEVDRAQELAVQGQPMEPVLVELRGHLTTVINDIRETLHDLRTDVTDDRDLPTTLRQHLARITDRRDLRSKLELDVSTDARPTRNTERELWQIALEALTNVEKHARASLVTVRYATRPGHASLSVRDDGIGLNTGSGRADRYGMIGMRERAEAIGAVLRVESPPEGGTVVTVELSE
ncbi:MAG: sensor signal transduction histidine kinase [Ilumatobacteraceae bacterium]|nr:sensor signal transduction histidine kinase [Ilumatobacteraceae bacterium]